MLKLSNEQLTRLALHTTGITNILVDALLTPPAPESEGAETEVEIDVFVVGSGAPEPDEEAENEPEALNLDALCGEWTTRRKCELLIFKAEPGYMVALGKKPKKGETGDCYLLHNGGDCLCFNAGFGTTHLWHDEQTDTITLYPGGKYTRVKTKEK